MRQRSPWSTILGGVILLGFAIFHFTTAYAPSDSTPLHGVEGSIASVTTRWVYHSAKGGGWSSPIVTISLDNGQSLHFTGHSRAETPAAQPLAALQRGTPLSAQVDATGEIWELSADDRQVVTLSDTLARHHELKRTRNLITLLMLATGVGLGAYGVRRLKTEGSGSPLDS